MAMRSTESAGNATDRAEPDRREPGLITSDFGEGQVPGTGGPWRWFFTAVWLVYLIQPVAALFGHGDERAERVCGVGGIVISNVLAVNRACRRLRLHFRELANLIGDGRSDARKIIH